MIVFKEYFKKKEATAPEPQESVMFFDDQSWWNLTFDAVGDLVSIHDTDKRCVKANRAARKFLQRTRAEMHGRTCHRLFAGSDRPCRGCPAGLAGEGKWGDNVEMEMRLGGHIFLVSCSPIITDDRVRGFVRVAKDINRQKLLEKELIEARKMESIATLAGGIGHDFNNILGAILGNTDLLLYRISGAGRSAQESGLESVITVEEIREHLQAIRIAGNRAKGLINQIQAFSRRTNSRKLDIDITPVIKETLKLLRASLPSTIEIRSDLDAGGGHIHADATQIQQVVMNLCTNGAQAMQEKGGLLTVELKPVSVGADGRDEGVALQPGDYLRLSIGDTGVGMSGEVRKRIFDPFFTTREPGSGQGMGLAVIHGIVDNHQGVIDVRSEEGRGSRFTIYFPRKAPAAEEGMDSLTGMVGGNETILLVDDEDAILSMRSKMLKYLGYNILTATNGLDGYALFRKQVRQIDLVITDNTMPLMTGLQLSREISKISDVPIIFCSGLDNVISERDAADAGIRRVFQKPVSITRLAPAIREVLNT